MVAASVMLLASAAQAAPIVLDGDSATTGLLLPTQALVTSAGTITLVQNGNFQFETSTSDAEFVAAGASGNQFDILNSSNPAPVLVFDFDVSQISFIYGGNSGGIIVQALDINGLVIASFVQASTDVGQPAGPQTLSAAGIRGLRWNDTLAAFTYAALDNITIEPTADATIPEPATLALLGAGLLGLGAARRRRRSLPA
jgi:hypothetical protein